MHLLRAAALASSLATASIPSSDGTFTGCFKADGGQLRLIDPTTDSCRNGELQVTWNQNAPSSFIQATPLFVGDPNCPTGGTEFVWQGATTYACNGTPGATGPVGPTGPMGYTGAMGPMGPAGAMGPVGPQGPMGIPGPMGTAGVDGLPGLQGPAGPAGATGPQGPAGAVGAIGPQGPAGPVGPAGATGPQGPQGEKGDAGTTGPQGPAGATGPTGPTGPAGLSVTLTQLLPGDANCPYGGVAVNAESGTAYVCGASQGYPLLVDATAMQKIDAWAGLPAETHWSLCYKATRDNGGFSFATSSTTSSTAAFHSRCDGLPRTFFVAKSSAGALFGGYAGQPWGAATCGYKYDPAAFLFSLTNSFRHGLISSSASSYAMYDCPTLGPTFGMGHDFQTNLKDQASATLGYSYVCRTGNGSSLCNTDYTGMASPVVLVELEVYAAQ